MTHQWQDKSYKSNTHTAKDLQWTVFLDELILGFLFRDEHR